MKLKRTTIPRNNGRTVMFLGLTLILSAAILPTACTPSIEPSPSIVQIWASGSLIRSGVAVGDGTQVLTVLEYIQGKTTDLTVAAGDGKKYPASIIAVDPRTSITLLKVAGVKFPTASAFAPDQEIKAEQSVTIQGWRDSKFKLARALSGTEPGGNPPQFHVRYSIIDDSFAQPGDVIVGKDGKIFGLIGNYNFGPIPAPIPPSYIPPVITMSSAMDLLSSDYKQRPWVKGPVGFSILTPNTTSAYLQVRDNYQAVTDSVNQILNSLGHPLTLDALQQMNLRFMGPTSGNLLWLNYAFLVQMRSADGTLLAEGKWIGIAWGRPDQPAVLFYGIDSATVAGGFLITGDLSSLSGSI